MNLWRRGDGARGWLARFASAQPFRSFLLQGLGPPFRRHLLTMDLGRLLVAYTEAVCKIHTKNQRLLHATKHSYLFARIDRL